MMRTIPVAARLLTWECMSTFDEIPAQAELEGMFEKEFPRTCLRLKEGGGFYRIWHLVSFNSSEGRRSRFLVALVENPLVVGRQRALPRQIYMMAIADKWMRSADSPALPNASCENDGNYLCYGYTDNVLCILVYFEGRLCHWSEEVFAGELSVQIREMKLMRSLERFRRFLKSDALFSRAKNFEEILLQDDFSRVLFKKASRDSFWRGRDLRKSEINAVKSPREFWNGLLGRKMLWLFVAVAIAVFWNGRNVSDWGGALKNAVAPVSIELSLPPEWDLVEELRENPVVVKPKCKLPEFLLKGVVGEKIAMVSVEGSQTHTLALGDSLGLFAVKTIGRDHVELICGDSNIVKKVGAREP